MSRSATAGLAAGRRRAAARARLAAVATLVGGIVLATAASSSPAAGPPRTGPTRLQVVAKEFYYILSRRSVPAGPAIVQLVDFGQDPHDLRMERIGSSRVYGTPIIQPGTLYNLSVDLQPGTYELWCSVADHRELGMEARLLVTPDASR